MSGLDELYGSDDANESAPATVAPEPAPAQPVEPSQAAPVEAVVTPEPVVTPPPSPTVPLAAQLDERDRRKAAEARAHALEQRLAAIERAKQEAAAQRPNVLDDPDAYDAWWDNRFRTFEQSFDQRLESAVTQERMSNSMDKWSEKLGEEQWNKLNSWIKSSWSQATHAEAMRQRDPYGWANKQFEQVERVQRARTLEEQLGGKTLDEVVAERVAAALATAQPAQPAPAAAPSQPRDQGGRFASPSQTQRHEPPSLNEVTAAVTALNGAGGGSALEELYQ